MLRRVGSSSACSTGTSERFPPTRMGRLVGYCLDWYLASYSGLPSQAGIHSLQPALPSQGVDDPADTRVEFSWCIPVTAVVLHVHDIIITAVFCYSTSSLMPRPHPPLGMRLQYQESVILLPRL